MFDTAKYETKMQAALAHFEDELKKIRTGRAHTSMLDGIFVEVYCTQLPLNQAATISTPEPQWLQVTPFDPTNVEAIVTAIRSNQSLGFNPSDDGRIVRVPVPQLTEERRREIVKQLGQKVEDCRIAIRNVRGDGIKDAKAMKNDKKLSQDDYSRVEKDLDKSVSEFQVRIEEITKAKEKEILTI